MTELVWIVIDLLPLGAISAALAWGLVRNKDSRQGGLPAIGWFMSIGLATLIGLLSLTGLPPWKSIESKHWLVMAVVPAAFFVALIGSIPKTPKVLTWLLRVLVAAGVAPVLMQPMVRYNWSVSEAAGWLGGLGATILAVWILMHLYTVRYGGRAPLFVIGATAAGVAACTFASGSITAGQLTGSFAVVLGGAWLATSRSKTCTHAGPALTDLTIPLLLGLLINSWAYSWQMQHEPWASRVVAILLVVAPLGLWADRLPWLKRLSSTRQAVLGSAVSLSLIAVALSIAGYEAYLRAQATGPSYY